jgi:hypothetical protein
MHSMFRNRDCPSLNPKRTHVIPEVNFKICYVEFECIVLVHGSTIFFLMIPLFLCQIIKKKYGPQQKSCQIDQKTS